MITSYHAKYFAYELTKRCASDSIEKLAAALSDAQVDLNPHQVEAALFAFRSPFSPGAILADEVGLGKTIEAGLLISHQRACPRLGGRGGRGPAGAEADHGERFSLPVSQLVSRCISLVHEGPRRLSICMIRWLGLFQDSFAHTRHPVIVIHDAPI
jgi:hypothetical protein